MPGLPYTCGIFSRRHMVGTHTSVAVKHAMHAGAIVLGTTNISEGLMWHESFNQVQ